VNKLENSLQVKLRIGVAQRATFFRGTKVPRFHQMAPA